MRAAADAYENNTVDKVLRIYNAVELYWPTFGSQCEEVAQLIMPNMANTFMRENYNFPGLKKTQRQVDASGMVANVKFSAICDSMITPFSSKWHNLEASNPYVQKNRQVRLWFEQATQNIFHLRYMAAANFRKQNQVRYQQVGAFGNGPMFVDQLYDLHGRPARGFRYKSFPMGEVRIRTNFQNQVDTLVRPFRLTARQAAQQWGEDKLPEGLEEAYEKDSETLFDFFHCVYPNDEYEPGARLSVRGKPFASYYVSVQGRRLMQEGGYNSFPFSLARYAQAPNEVYGRGWAMDVLPALKTLNAEKATFLKVGHRIADPVLLLADDGLTDFSLVPGAQNKGGLTADGKPLVQPLEMGNLPITKEMMDEERQLIGENSLTTIFSALVENPQMTATQVIELINQKGVFLAPTVGAMASDLEQQIEREIDLAQQMGLLPPMPPLLREAKGEYKIVHTSPLFKAARAGEASGFLRTVESALQVAGQTGDPSVLDSFDFDTAFSEIARIQDVPESWMSSDAAIAQKRQARAKQQQTQQQIQALPAQAAMLKAQAVVRKNGGGLPADQQSQAA